MADHVIRHATLSKLTHFQEILAEEGLGSHPSCVNFGDRLVGVPLFQAL